jgi:hypothetical protein
VDEIQKDVDEIQEDVEEISEEEDSEELQNKIMLEKIESQLQILLKEIESIKDRK